jgi:hypothetical protein
MIINWLMAILIFPNASVTTSADILITISSVPTFSLATFGAIMCVVASTFSKTFFGLVSSICSNSSVVRMAILLIDSFLFIVYTVFDLGFYKREKNGSTT